MPLSYLSFRMDSEVARTCEKFESKELSVVER